MKKSALYLVNLALLVIAITCGCSKLTEPDEVSPWEPVIDPANFVTTFTNPYFPIIPGRTMVYTGEVDGEWDSIEVYETDQSIQIMGIQCAVVEFREWINGELAEVAYDWYAQDRDGNVWYFGELVNNYENGTPVDNGGSWTAGEDDALPGIVMKATPQIGDHYYQEFYEGEAVDQATVLSLTESITVPFGNYTNVLKTEDWTDLEPGKTEHKFYAPGVGQIRSLKATGAVGAEDLVAIRMD